MSAKVDALYQKRENISISHATPITPIVIFCEIRGLNIYIVVDFQMILTRETRQENINYLNSN